MEMEPSHLFVSCRRKPRLHALRGLSAFPDRWVVEGELGVSDLSPVRCHLRYPPGSVAASLLRVADNLDQMI